MNAAPRLDVPSQDPQTPTFPSTTLADIPKTASRFSKRRIGLLGLLMIAGMIIGRFSTLPHPQKTVLFGQPPKHGVFQAMYRWNGFYRAEGALKDINRNR